MGGGLEPPGALASAAALVNNYANGIANGGLLDPNCITIAYISQRTIRETLRPSAESA
jgi:hypothetical protein